MVGDACTISKEKHNQDVHMLENLPQTVLLHRSLNSDAGCTLIWCFTIQRKTKKKKKKDLSKAEFGSGASAVTKLDSRLSYLDRKQQSACSYFSYLSRVLCTILSGTFKSRHCRVPTTVQ